MTTCLGDGPAGKSVEFGSMMSARLLARLNISGIRNGWMPFSGSSMQTRPVDSGSLASTANARNRSVPSDSELAAYASLSLIVTIRVSVSRTSSRSTSTEWIPGMRSESRAATSELLPSLFRVAGRCSPVGLTCDSLRNSSDFRSADGSSCRRRQVCISRRAANAVAWDIVFTPESTVWGDLRAGICGGRPVLFRPSPRCTSPLRTMTFWSVPSAGVVSMNAAVRFPGPET